MNVQAEQQVKNPTEGSPKPAAHGKKRNPGASLPEDLQAILGGTGRRRPLIREGRMDDEIKIDLADLVPSADELRHLAYYSTSGDMAGHPIGHHSRRSIKAPDTARRTKADTHKAGKTPYDPWIIWLSKHLARNPWTFTPSIQFPVPKDGGAPGQQRWISDPSEAKRLVALFVRQTIERRVEAQLHRGQLGGRSNRWLRRFAGRSLDRKGATAQDRVAYQARRYIRNGHPWACTIDLANAFGLLPKKAVVPGLREAGLTPKGIEYVWRLARIDAISARSRAPVRSAKHIGVEQGGVLSALVMNLGLAPILTELEKTDDVKILTYLDDIYIFTKTEDEAHRAFARFKELARKSGFRNVRALGTGRKASRIFEVSEDHPLTVLKRYSITPKTIGLTPLAIDFVREKAIRLGVPLNGPSVIRKLASQQAITKKGIVRTIGSLLGSTISTDSTTSSSSCSAEATAGGEVNDAYRTSPGEVGVQDTIGSSSGPAGALAGDGVEDVSPARERQVGVEGVPREHPDNEVAYAGTVLPVQGGRVREPALVVLMADGGEEERGELDHPAGTVMTEDLLELLSNQDDVRRHDVPCAPPLDGHSRNRARREPSGSRRTSNDEAPGTLSVRAGNPVPGDGPTKKGGGQALQDAHPPAPSVLRINDEKIINQLRGMEPLNAGSSFKATGTCDLRGLQKLFDRDHDIVISVGVCLRAARFRNQVKVVINHREPWTSLPRILGNRLDPVYRRIHEHRDPKDGAFVITLRRRRPPTRRPRLPPPPRADLVIYQVRRGPVTGTWRVKLRSGSQPPRWDDVSGGTVPADAVANVVADVLSRCAAGTIAVKADPVIVGLVIPRDHGEGPRMNRPRLVGLHGAQQRLLARHSWELEDGWLVARRRP